MEVFFLRLFLLKQIRKVHMFVKLHPVYVYIGEIKWCFIAKTWQNKIITYIKLITLDFSLCLSKIAFQHGDKKKSEAVFRKVLSSDIKSPVCYSIMLSC